MRIPILIGLFMLTTAPTVAQTERTLTPMEFYESFNIRTIGTAFWQNLRYYCQSYPKDYFEIYEINDHEIELVFGNDHYIYFRFSENNLIIQHEAIYSGTLRHSSEFTAYYDEEHSEWRAYGDLFAEIMDDCVQYPE